MSILATIGNGLDTVGKGLDSFGLGGLGEDLEKVFGDFGFLDSSFRKASFWAQATEDKTERGIVVHEYPFQEGGVLDDMGRKARKYKITAICFGPDWKGQLSGLTEALDKGGPGDLVHPYIGSRTVMVNDYTVSKEAAGPDSATVVMNFTEAEQGVAFFSGETSLLGKVLSIQDKIERVLAEVREGLENTVGAVLHLVESAGGGVIAEASAIVSTATGFYGAAERLGDSVQERLNMAEDVLYSPLALLDSQKRAADAIVAAHAPKSTDADTQTVAWRNMSDALPGISLAYTAGSASGIGGSGTGGSGNASDSFAAPLPKMIPYEALPGYDRALAALLVSDTAGDTPVGQSGGMSGPLGEIGGGSAPSALTEGVSLDALPVADLPVADLPGRVAARLAVAANTIQTESLAHHACAMLTAQAQDPTLSPAQIEGIVGNLRRRLQDCIEAHRAACDTAIAHPAVENLRSAALAVQQLGRALIEARPPLTVHTVAAPGNHHLLAHALYGDAARAGELLRLNPQIRQPNLLTRGTPVRGYAQ